MAESQYEFERFYNREGFNRSLNHFQAVSSLLADFEDGYNLADILNTLLGDKDIQQDQINPILYALLVEKYGYRCDTYNMSSFIEDFTHIKQQCSTWNGIDVVVAYQHPDMGITLINPKNPDHWDIVQSLRKNELITIFAGGFSDEVLPKVAASAIDTIIRFLEGKKTKSPATLQKGDYEFLSFAEDDQDEDAADEHENGMSFRASGTERSRPKAKREPARASASSGRPDGEEKDEDTNESGIPAAPAPVSPPSGSRRMTPMYSVPVSNELFHNGNVEAWKKIIQSYQLKYPGTDVLVFYEGERIHDINTLFKWGKVKHGSTILFAIVGENIKDAAKLQRYFRQGASSQFEAFLRVPVNTVLKLF
jgi:hypothetical protein